MAILLFVYCALIAGSCGGDGEGPPDAAASQLGQTTRHDLLELSHLADVDHHGLYIDFGSPARSKYTVGNWGSGWGSDGADGDITFTYLGETGRVFFPVEAPTALTLRFEMMPIGSHRVQVFFNGESLEGIVLREGEVFGTYDVSVPIERVRAGENYILLRSGGTRVVNGEAVALAMSSLRVIEGTPAEDDSFVPPEWDTLTSVVDIGGSERRALAVRAPTILSYFIEVPERGRLSFGLGGEGRDLRARVWVTPDGGPRNEIFNSTPNGRWADQVLNLEGYAGQVVRLELEAAGSGQGRVAWSAPVILGERPIVAPRPEAPQNVIVLLVDTLRADRLRPYDPTSRVQTPTLDRLAREGVLFENAQAPENWTKPSVASVLTGLTPATHGAKTSEARLPASAELVSEAFDAAGFATGSFIANGYVSDRFGFDQGWDNYNNFIRDGRSTEAEDVFREAGNFVEAHRSERFFVYIQTIDPHVPYDPPADYLAMYDSSAYAGAVQPRLTPDLLEQAKRHEVTFNEADRARLLGLHDGEISYHDHFLGEFLARLETLGVAENTLVVVTSDHGEEFDDHGSWGHGHSIFQELLHVPLIFHLPGRLPEGRRVDTTVSTLNVAQTVVDLAGIGGMERAEGRSLVPDLLGDVPLGPQAAFSDFQDIRRVVRAGRYKLVARANLSSVIFDLQADPDELVEHELADMPIAGRYTRILLGQYLGAANRGQWIRAHQDAVAPLAAEEAEMDETIRAQLQALGYAN